MHIDCASEMRAGRMRIAGNGTFAALARHPLDETRAVLTNRLNHPPVWIIFQPTKNTIDLDHKESRDPDKNLQAASHVIRSLYSRASF